MTWWTTAYRDRARIAPSDHPHAVGVVDSPEATMSHGVAYPIGHVGGWRHNFDVWPTAPEYLGPAEVTWRLAVDGVEVEERFVLRLGRFVAMTFEGEDDPGPAPE